MASDPAILLVDNDVTCVELLKTILEINGYEVDLVSNGSDALSKLSGKKYSCVITDFVLGDTRGDELAALIKAKDPRVPILLLTGFKSMIDSAKLLEFKYVFDKPADPKHVLAILDLIRPRVRY